MTTSWAFLLVAFMALCGFAVVIAVMVVIFRAATRTSDRPSGNARPGDDGHTFVPPVIGDDSLTNPAHPLYHLHHPTSGEPSHHHGTDAGFSPSSFDSTPSSSPSFDSGSSSSSSFDSGSSSAGSDSGGSGCG